MYLRTLFAGSIFALSVSAGPIVTVSTNPATLISTILGSGITVVGTPTFTGASTQAGTFTGGPASTIGFDSGILLTTGLASSAAGNYAGADKPNSVVGSAGDSDLSKLVGNSATFDAAVLQFSFTSTQPTLFFNYTFASAEYPNFVASKYNDVFAFMVNGVNYALVPGTTIPVAVNNVNATTNSAYFTKYNAAGDPTPYGGQTKVLSFSAPLLTSGTNTIKIAIADTSDANLDSAVFLQAGSFGVAPMPIGPTTPEPGTIMLMGVGLAVVGFLRLRLS